MSESAIVNYHIKSADNQAFHFDVDGIVGNLVSPELLPTRISVTDVRNNRSSINFETDSITFERHASRIEDYSDPSDWRDTYDTELKLLLEDRIGAKDVIVFDHTVRIDALDAERRPARNVHTDYSRAGAEQRLIDIVGEDRARAFRAGHYAFVNVWRPIEHPILTSPLGFIRPRSMADDDWMTIELIYPDRVGQILGVAANHNHDWFYMSRMTPTDVAIFNIYDNAGRPFLGHSALDMADAIDVTAPRKSIESRTLVRYR
ncbi:MAG: CmcJ/NvfI family oxidoreductase [Pseudomonadota bacterium]